MGLKELSIKDRLIFNEFLGKRSHELSAYAFLNIYIWRAHYKISWAVIEESLCVFFQDSLGCFLYLAPQGKKPNPAAVRETFEIMDKSNRNKHVSRIENVEDEDITFFRDAGYACVKKFPEYLCGRADLAALKGIRFKSKRAVFNYFTKNYKYEYLPFSLRHKDQCLSLYRLWMDERRSRNQDHIYQGMLKDNLACLEELLGEYNNLRVTGRVVKVGGKLKAFTFGFKLNSGTFCVLFEIADLSVKGISQFIFREFCEELKDYKYINIMDDSGLENLKTVKQSYHPERMIPAYIVKRNGA